MYTFFVLLVRVVFITKRGSGKMCVVSVSSAVTYSISEIRLSWLPKWTLCSFERRSWCANRSDLRRASSSYRFTSALSLSFSSCKRDSITDSVVLSLSYSLSWPSCWKESSLSLSEKVISLCGCAAAVLLRVVSAQRDVAACKASSIPFRCQAVTMSCPQ